MQPAIVVAAPDFQAIFARKEKELATEQALKMEGLRYEYEIRQRIYDVAQVEVNGIYYLPYQARVMTINIVLGEGVYQAKDYGHEVLAKLLETFKPVEMYKVNVQGTTSFITKNWLEHGNNIEAQTYTNVNRIAPITVTFETDSRLHVTAVAKWSAYVSGENKFCEFHVKVPLDLTCWGKSEITYRNKSNPKLLASDEINPNEGKIMSYQSGRPGIDPSPTVLYFPEDSPAFEYHPGKWAYMMCTKP